MLYPGRFILIESVHYFPGLPMEATMMWITYPWPFGKIGCQFMVIFSEAAAYVSVFTMFAFTFERFTAVCYPLRPSLHSTVKRTRYIIVAIWIIGE